MAREGILVKPYERLNQSQIEQIHEASMDILSDPGIICYNREAASIFHDHGACVTPSSDSSCWILEIPETLIRSAVSKAPSVVKLGARNEENSLILDAEQLRVYFASGSETNIWLESKFDSFTNKKNPSLEVRLPTFYPRRGTVDDLCQSAHLAEYLDSLDGFIRPVNIQDDDINEDNKDVNKFFACLNNTTKHVMAGLTNLAQLDRVIKMAEIVAGGEEGSYEHLT